MSRIRLDPLSSTGASIVSPIAPVITGGTTSSSSDSVPDATTTSKGIVQLAGDLGGTAALPLIKRTSRFIVAPYGDTRPADYTCATADSNQTEINQAIDAATAIGGDVDLLDGEFVVSSAIIPKDNVWLRGQGMFQTKISVKAGLSSSFSMIDNFAAHNADNEPTWYGGTISDMEIDGSNMNNTDEGKGIFSIKLESCLIARIYCHDTTATGIGADDYIGSTIKDCIVSDCGYMNVADITNIVYSVNTFTVTAPSHGKSVSDEIVITGMTPRQYNGKYLVTSVTDANTFVIDTSNNVGKLQLSRDPGAATVFGRISDYNIGHSGIGIASGAYIKESNLITGNYCFRNQNNNIFVETNDNVTGLNAGYTMTGNFSYEGGQCGFRNTGTRNCTITDNFDYGSLIGGQMSAFYLTKTITVASWLAGVATFTTSTAHALTMLPTPLEVTIAGMTPSGYNGTYTVTSVPSTTTFTVAITADPGTATIFGTAYENVHPVTGSSFKNNIFSHNVLYGYYHEPMGEDTEVIGNTFKYSQFYGAYLASGRVIFNDNKVYGNGRTGLSIPTGNITMPITDITVHDNHIFNNGQNTAATYDGIDIDSDSDTPLSHVSIRGNNIYDNQAVQTQRYGVLIRSGGANSYITVADNDLARNLTAPILIQDTSNTIYVDNNVGVNPQGKYDLGNITGSVTFDSTLASYFKGTVTGNITAVMPANVVNGAIMQWTLIQDGTGGYTLTLPGNAAAQESLQLSPGANAIDTITWVYDLGTTKWRVLSQSLTKQGTQNMAEAANFAFGATTGTKIGTSTAQKLAFFNSTPIAQPSAAGDLGTVLSNLGLRAAGTAYPITTSGAVAFNATTLATDTTTGLKIGTATNQKLGFYNSAPIVQPTGDIVTALGNLGLITSGTVALAATVTTNANLTGPITSSGNATSIASQTGTGTKFVVDTSPTITTPTIAQINDTNGNAYLASVATASAVTYLSITNAISGGTVTLGLTGGSNGNLLIKGQGTGIITQRPGTDGTNSIRIQNAAGSTTVLAADTSNSRIGINTTTPADTLSVNGNLNLITAGNKLKITTGSNASAGTGTLTAGTVTINTTAVTANSLIFLTDTASTLTNVGVLSVTAKSAGTSFTVTSTNVLDTGTFNWFFVN